MSQEYATIFDNPNYQAAIGFRNFGVGGYMQPYTVNGRQEWNPRMTVRDEIKSMERGRANVVWTNNARKPIKMDSTGQRVRPRTIFVDTTPPGQIASLTAQDYSDPAVDIDKYIDLVIKANRDPSSTNIDKSIYDPYVDPFWYNLNLEHTDILASGEEAKPGVFQKRAAGGVITTQDSPAINVINVAAEIQGMQVDEFVLTQAISSRTTPNLTLSFDQWNGFTVYQDIAEGDATYQQKGNFTRKSYGLRKDVGHIAITDEATMVPDRDVWTYHVQHVGREMIKLQNLKVAIEILTATTTTGTGDWDARTNGLSDANPILDVRKAAREIKANGMRADTLISGSDPFTSFGGNTNIKGTTEPMPAMNFGTRVEVSQFLPGMTWYIDDLASQTGVIILNKTAVSRLQGPQRTAMYRSEERGINAYVTRDWNRVVTVDPTLIRKIINVVTP